MPYCSKHSRVNKLCAEVSIVIVKRRTLEVYLIRHMLQGGPSGSCRKRPSDLSPLVIDVLIKCSYQAWSRPPHGPHTSAYPPTSLGTTAPLAERLCSEKGEGSPLPRDISDGGAKKFPAGCPSRTSGQSTNNGVALYARNCGAAAAKCRQLEWICGLRLRPCTLHAEAVV